METTVDLGKFQYKACVGLIILLITASLFKFCISIQGLCRFNSPDTPAKNPDDSISIQGLCRFNLSAPDSNAR